MDNNLLLGNIIQCTLGTNCYLCRQKLLGRAWRQALCETLALPGSQVDFSCPVGRPWGYIPKDSPITLSEQQQYVCNFCRSISCFENLDKPTDCPEKKWNKTIDVVYPYFATEAESDEFRYSLRSLRNLQEKPNVWIVGDKPEWLDTSKVNYIPHSRTSKNRDIDSAAKFKLAAQHPKMGHHFIYMNDDIYFIAPVSTPFLAIPRYIADYSGDVESFIAISPWQKTSVRGFLALEQRKYPARDYSLHWPYVFNTEKFLDLYPEFQLDSTPHNLEIIYFNMHTARPIPFDGGIIRVHSFFSVPALYRLVKNAIVLNNKKDAFNTVAGLLSTLFPDQSPYELPTKKRKKSTQTIDIKVVEEEIGMPLPEFMSHLRLDIAGRNTTPYVFKDTSRIFNPLQHYTLVSIYQDRKQMIRWGCKRKSMDKAILNNTARLCNNTLLRRSLVENPRLSGIKFETISNETVIDISIKNIDDQHVNAGLKIATEGNVIYLLPSDSRANNYSTLRDKILNLLKRSSYLSERLTLADFLEDTGKNIECSLVYSFWAIDMNNTIYRDSIQDVIPEVCTQWLPYHPVLTP